MLRIYLKKGAPGVVTRATLEGNERVLNGGRVRGFCTEALLDQRIAASAWCSGRIWATGSAGGDFEGMDRQCGVCRTTALQLR